MPYIGDLHIPDTLSLNAELFNSDNQRRTVSGRLITKLAPSQKWRVTLDYEDRTTDLANPGLRVALYAKCQEMRTSNAPVTFKSPYDDQEHTVLMKCIKPLPPKVTYLGGDNPSLYVNCGATFEEI